MFGSCQPNKNAHVQSKMTSFTMKKGYHCLRLGQLSFWIRSFLFCSEFRTVFCSYGNPEWTQVKYLMGILIFNMCRQYSTSHAFTKLVGGPPK